MFKRLNTIILRSESWIYIVLIFLLTFPAIVPVFSSGLDAGYVWAVNYLFVHDYETLKNLKFPIGVLGFLKMPTTEGSNFLISMLFQSVLKLFFLYRFIRLARENGRSEFITVLVALIAAAFMKIDFLIIAICAIQGFNFLAKRNPLEFIAMIFIAYIGLCIKASIGIISFSVVGSVLLLYFFHEKNKSRSGMLVLYMVAVVSLVGLIIYGSLERPFMVIFESLKISSDYSSASLHPENDWAVLSVFIASILLSPLLVRSKRFIQAYVILFPSLFLMWKHSISREEVGHALFLYQYLFIFWSLIFSCTKIRFSTIFILACISIYFYHANLKQLPSYDKKLVEVSVGLGNFSKSVINYKVFVDECKNASFNNIEKLELEQHVREKIGDATVDVFPWQLAYIPANDLNWRCRQNLQGGGYSYWLDSISAASFSLESGPSFVIVNLSRDKYEGFFGSIDNIHLFHYCPLSVSAIFKNYEVIHVTDNYMLMEKSLDPNLVSEKLSSNWSHSNWNEWVSMPKTMDHAVVLYCKYKPSLSTRIKSFFYKSEMYFIELKMNDGKVLRYRINPSAMARGLWLHPLSRFPQYEGLSEEVIEFRIIHSYEKELSPFKYKIGKFKISDADFFLVRTDSTYGQIIYMNDFEKQNYRSLENKSLSKEMADDQHQILGTDQFSYTYKFKLDTLWSKFDSGLTHMLVEADVEFARANEKLNFAISVKESENDLWKVTKPKLLRSIDWDYMYNVKQLDRYDHQTGILEIYVWNNGDGDVKIDNLRVKITGLIRRKY